MKNIAILFALLMMSYASAIGSSLNETNSINNQEGGCPGVLLIYLPNSTADQGPAIYVCEFDPVPEGYHYAADQVCAQATIDADSYCLTDFWDGICQDSYNFCRFGCTTFTYYLPDVVGDGPALVVCAGDPAPLGYTVAANQECAESVINNDLFCFDTQWDQICQDAYYLCTGECSEVIYLPNSVPYQGPAIIQCSFDPWPEGYHPADDQACAQSTIDLDPYCLTDFWDGLCVEAYANCKFACEGYSTVYLPDVIGGGPAIVICDGGPAPKGYTAAVNQACAQTVIDMDLYCLITLWDEICQSEYEACNYECQAPTDLAVVENGFGTASPSVNATWTNPEGTVYCEVRGGRISNASYNAGEPEFANIVNTRIITNTNGSTVNFNVALYNNPNIPFTIGARYGYEVRCQCADGSGLSGWANITPASTFVVPAAPAGVEVSNGKLLDAGLESMSIYPNPAKAIVNVEIELIEEGSVDIQIFNAVGQLVMQERNSGAKANIRMDVSELDAGLYIMSVHTDIGIVTERLIIE
jgi:hypothetical protein